MNRTDCLSVFLYDILLQISNTQKKKKKNRNEESLPLESVIATDAETYTSLMMTVTCLTLSIKSLPLIRVNVYGTLRGVREERVIEKRGRRINI